jgi:hypothetical protein
MMARILTTIIVLGALAIPASAGASYGTVSGGSDDSGQSVGAPDYSSLNATAPPVSEPSTESGYSSLNSISGSPSETPTLVSGSPASTGDGFDWGDAALGAGAVMALVAFGGAALLTVRRRTAMSPSAS